MRGADSYNEALFSTVRLEDFVPATHSLRPIRNWVNEALSKMYAKFSAMYEADLKGGCPSIAPEKLMRAILLQVLYSVRSERQLVEQINYNLLFRWFVGLAIEDAVWNHSVFSKNRDRLIEHEAVTELFNVTEEMADKRGVLSGSTSVWPGRFTKDAHDPFHATSRLTDLVDKDSFQTFSENLGKAPYRLAVHSYPTRPP